MSNNKEINGLASVSTDTDDAVGVSAPQWFIAIVNARSEKTVARKLTSLGIENYLPTCRELHIWKTGRRVKVDRIVIPAKIFIRCTEARRREIVRLPFIFRFMTNIAGGKDSDTRRPIATVPDRDIERLRFMLGASDVNAEVTFSHALVKGCRVEVLRGPLQGLQGEVTGTPRNPNSRLYINIGVLGSASVLINPLDIKPLA